MRLKCGLLGAGSSLIDYALSLVDGHEHLRKDLEKPSSEKVTLKRYRGEKTKSETPEHSSLKYRIEEAVLETLLLDVACRLISRPDPFKHSKSWQLLSIEIKV